MSEELRTLRRSWRYVYNNMTSFEKANLGYSRKKISELGWKETEITVYDGEFFDKTDIWRPYPYTYTYRSRHSLNGTAIDIRDLSECFYPVSINWKSQVVRPFFLSLRLAFCARAKSYWYSLYILFYLIASSLFINKPQKALFSIKSNSASL